MKSLLYLLSFYALLSSLVLAALTVDFYKRQPKYEDGTCFQQNQDITLKVDEFDGSFYNLTIFLHKIPVRQFELPKTRFERDMSELQFFQFTCTEFGL